MRTFYLLLIPALLLGACTKKTEAPEPLPPASGMYFPPTTGSDWETTAPASLGWNTTALNELYTYLESKGTKGFIIARNGRLVTERYFGSFGAESTWYWASAGKTLTAALVGIAQGEGKLRLSDKTGQYLGTGWTSLPAAKEDAITVRHQLTMTTGLDDGGDADCTEPTCLTYKGDAGTRWAYHNAPYTLLEKVVERATGASYNTYFAQKIRDRIGMNGTWIKTGYNNVYYSNVRSAARFGILLLNKGVWNGMTILPDAAYVDAQVNSTQTLNPSYGYLTWLNGKSSYMLPTVQASFAGMLVPNAPANLYAALGKNDQKIYVVPSLGLVVVRMGEAAGNSHLALSSFDNELWGKLKGVIGY
jgi:CubicO group peptidase (beta-lactamase class C family)